MKKLIFIGLCILTILIFRSNNKTSYANKTAAPAPKLHALVVHKTLTVEEIVDAEFVNEPTVVRSQVKIIVFCESRWNKDDRNTSSGALGLFQILPSTWNRFCVDLQDPKNATQSAQCAHRIYNYDKNSNGNGWSQWTCLPTTQSD
jgi:hypothetical protein